ncbi:DUF7873 family protein [Nocardia acidivorans]|uniref:DUF7873 family protein n=1 Tax=Nocardia acidivorans TaxID=404580 RepID=UPI000830442F|nr:hypothetical protein [Nocardia acidivorans]
MTRLNQIVAVEKGIKSRTFPSSPIKFSGALPAKRVNDLTDRVEKHQQAVKFAREEANNAEITQRKPGEEIFGYLFG